jgi:hypothetical protein
VKLALKHIAWNNIQINIPPTWEIGRIGTHELIFQDGAKPRLELKWNKIKGNFSHGRHLKRLTRLQKNALKQPIETWPLPPEWEKALTGFIASGFSWQSESSIGRGAVLFCPVCSRATLIQFFNNAPSDKTNTPEKVLESFKDHGDDGQTHWSVFDIRATLSDKFKLKHYRFQPGNYALEFSNGKQTLHLLRWAPASAFLDHQTLFQFAEIITHISQTDFSSGQINKNPAVEVRVEPFVKKKWLQRATSNPAFHVWRFWHLKEKNRILAIKIESKGAIDPNLTNVICKYYDSL